MPCFHDLSDDRSAPVTPLERGFLAAVVSLAPVTPAPILTQLGAARTCDDGTGRLVVRNACGSPCEWDAAYPFDAYAGSPGPQGCYNILLWLHDDGQLQAVELLMLETGPLRIEALATWLNAHALRRVDAGT